MNDQFPNPNEGMTKAARTALKAAAAATAFARDLRGLNWNFMFA